MSRWLWLPTTLRWTGLLDRRSGRLTPGLGLCGITRRQEFDIRCDDFRASVLDAVPLPLTRTQVPLDPDLHSAADEGAQRFRSAAKDRD